MKTLTLTRCFTVGISIGLLQFVVFAVQNETKQICCLGLIEINFNKIHLYRHSRSVLKEKSRLFMNPLGV